MKNYFVILSFIIMGLPSVVRADSDDQVSVNFHGSIKSVSCDIKTDSRQQNIQLGDYEVSDFTSTSSVGTKVPLNIVLENCSPSTSNAIVTFSGAADSASPNLLSLTSGTEQASGIGIEILDADGNSIAINSSGEKNPVSSVSSTLNFFLRYRGDGLPVYSGSANSVLYFDIAYQ